MLLKKTTTGFVIQIFDSEKGRFVEQEFVAGEQVDYEDEDGEPVDSECFEVDGQEPTLPFDMTQPKAVCPKCGTVLGMDIHGDEFCPKCAGSVELNVDDFAQDACELLCEKWTQAGGPVLLDVGLKKLSDLLRQFFREKAGET